MNYTFTGRMDVQRSIAASKDNDCLVVGESKGSSRQIGWEIPYETIATRKAKVKPPGIWYVRYISGRAILPDTTVRVSQS